MSEGRLHLVWLRRLEVVDPSSWDQYLAWAEKLVPVDWESHLSRDDVASHLKEEHDVAFHLTEESQN